MVTPVLHGRRRRKIVCLFSRCDHFAQRITAYSSYSDEKGKLIFHSCFNFTKGLIVVIFDSFFFQSAKNKVKFIKQLLKVQKTEALQIIRG